MDSIDAKAKKLAAIEKQMESLTDEERRNSSRMINLIVDRDVVFNDVLSANDSMEIIAKAKKLG